MNQRVSIARTAPITPVKIELSPDLPVPDFVSTYSWTPERIGALAVYCSDGRWGDAFDEFCHRRLNIPRYDRFAVPGGAAWITESTHPELRRAAHDQLEFLVRARAEAHRPHHALGLPVLRRQVRCRRERSV